MRKSKIVIANWKMNPSGFKLAESLYKSVSKTKLKFKNTEVVICPPVIYLSKLIKISKRFKLGVQNISHQNEGSFTGEISGNMAYDASARFVILGHSERRHMGENDELINQKLKIALNTSLVPILCIGEEVRDEHHEYFNFIKNQLDKALSGINKINLENIIIAYEPVWAIGKNAIREATPEEFREVAVFARKVLSDKFGSNNVSKIKIIYGGSVNPKNAKDFIVLGEADGFLIGRDSLDANKFIKILEITENAVN